MGIFKKLLGGGKAASGKKERARRSDAKEPKEKTAKKKAPRVKSSKDQAAAGTAASSRPSAKTAPADISETPMSSEEIIREAMRIRERKRAAVSNLTDDADDADDADDFGREDRGAFTEKVESSMKREEGENETPAKVKNEEIIREALRLREERIAEEKQTAQESPSVEPEEPESREELIRKAMRIRKEKQDLLADIDPELRKKLSLAVMAKFIKARGGDG